MTRYGKTFSAIFCSLGFGGAVAFAAPAVPEPGADLPPRLPDEPGLETETPAHPAGKAPLRFTLKHLKVEQPETDCSPEALEEIANKAAGHEITVQNLL